MGLLGQGLLGQGILGAGTSAPAAPSLSTIAKVQETHTIASTVGAAVTLDISSTGSDNLLTLGFTNSNDSTCTISSVHSQPSNTAWSQASQENDNTSTADNEIWQSEGNPSGDTSVVVTLTASPLATYQYNVAEWSGAATAGALDGHPTGVTGSGFDVLTPSITPNKTGELFIAVGCSGNNTISTLQGGYSALGWDTTNNFTRAAYLIATNSSAQQGYWAQTSSGNYSGTSASFEPAAPLTFWKNQPAKARIQSTPSKIQSAKARVQNTATTTQAAKARVQNTAATTQTAKARIQNTVTKTQSAVARIQVVGRTKTQSAIANISGGGTVTKTQTAKASIQNTATKTQTAIARIQVTGTKTQSAIAHIQIIRSSNQTAIARLSKTLVNNQSAVARIRTTVTKTQTAIANIVLAGGLPARCELWFSNGTVGNDNGAWPNYVQSDYDTIAGYGFTHLRINAIPSYLYGFGNPWWDFGNPPLTGTNPASQSIGLAQTNIQAQVALAHNAGLKCYFGIQLDNFNETTPGDPIIIPWCGSGSAPGAAGGNQTDHNGNTWSAYLTTLTRWAAGALAMGFDGITLDSEEYSVAGSWSATQSGFTEAQVQAAAKYWGTQVMDAIQAGFPSCPVVIYAGTHQYSFLENTFADEIEYFYNAADGTSWGAPGTGTAFSKNGTFTPFFEGMVAAGGFPELIYLDASFYYPNQIEGGPYSADSDNGWRNSIKYNESPFAAYGFPNTVKWAPFYWPLGGATTGGDGTASGDQIVTQAEWLNMQNAILGRSWYSIYQGSGSPFQYGGGDASSAPGATTGGNTATYAPMTAQARSATQTAISRILNTAVTQTQPAKARIRNTVTATQTAVARIASATKTATQTATARIQNVVTKTQSATGRISTHPTKTQSAIARVQKVFTNTQSAISRISNASLTKTQPAVARIQNTTVTKTQTAIANIIATGVRVKSITAISRIQILGQKTQSAIAHIVASVSKTQTAVARIQTTPTKTQTAKARIFVQTVTATQTAVANIVPAPTVQFVQTATARILNPATTKTQTAKATITISYPFTPPVVFDRPPYLPDTRGPARGLFRHYAPTPRGVNVYFLSDGTVVQDTATPENANTNIPYPWNPNDPGGPYSHINNWDNTTTDVSLPVYITQVFFGGHTYQVDLPTARKLAAAGYADLLPTLPPG